MEQTFETVADTVERRAPGRPRSPLAEKAAQWFIEQANLGNIVSGYAACKKFEIQENLFYRAVRHAGRGDLIKHFTTDANK